LGCKGCLTKQPHAKTIEDRTRSPSDERRTQIDTFAFGTQRLELKKMGMHFTHPAAMDSMGA